MFSVDKNPYKLAIAGGLLISLLPALFINLIAHYFPTTRPDDLQSVSDFFSGGIGPEQLVFFAIIVLVVPPIEEFVFRGLLWKMVRWIGASPKWTLVTTSLIFAAIHIEPLHILGLLPISFFIGWLRMRTNRLSASIVAHMTNNAVGCLLMML